MQGRQTRLDEHRQGALHSPRNLSTSTRGGAAGAYDATRRARRVFSLGLSSEVLDRATIDNGLRLLLEDIGSPADRAASSSDLRSSQFSRRFRVPAPHPHQMPSALELLALKTELEVSFGIP
jgi:hypothetical protein